MASQETYTPGHSDNAVAFMRRRTAESHGAFFTPYLRPGMRLLDAGCGPGTITLGLAAAVAPGSVDAIDANADGWADSEREATARGLAVTFHQASIYELPFADGTFDAVFSHALFEHLAEPGRALAELRRVMRPGAVIGLRAPDWDGNLTFPDDPAVIAAVDRFREFQRANGGNTEAGRRLAAWLREAGFADVQSLASYEVYPTADLIATFLALQLDQRGEAAHAEVLRRWAQHPDAFYAQTWGEAVGKKPL